MCVREKECVCVCERERERESERESSPALVEQLPANQLVACTAPHIGESENL